MAERIEADYERLEDLQRKFAARLEQLQNMTTSLGQRTEQLCADGWKGLGADAFKREMDTFMMPKLNRLCGAYDLGTQMVARIAETMGTAEQNASHVFDGGGE
jgi:WXG100 family type VII secretion target